MSKALNLYRSFCQTESNNVFTWGKTAPTLCPNSAAHTLQSSTTTIIDSIRSTDVELANVNKCPFGDLRTTEKSLVIELKSCFGLSAMRDIVETTGTGFVGNSVGDPEYTLRCTGSNDVARLFSAERGRYISGIGAEVGIGVRIPNEPVGNQVYCWGLYDNSNGFFFKYSASGLSVNVRRDGITTEVPFSQFNGDKCDGTGDSGYIWNNTTGNIYNILFSWYGYGQIDFAVQTPGNLRYKRVIMHSFVPTEQTSTKNPNLPISAEIYNNGTNAQALMFTAGRQYSVIGKYVPILRINSAYRLSAPVNSTTTFLPILTVRRKANYNGTAARLSGMDLIATTSQIIQIRAGGTLTNASFVNLPDQPPAETCLQMDQNATAISGGFVVWTGIVSADRSSVQQLSDFTYVLTEYNNLTVCSRGVSATNGNLTVCLRMNEEW